MDRESQSIALEKRHVHSVYDKIAPHFSNTRYKAWPRVKEFILDLEPGSLVADVGCGNGKYLGINNQIYKVGCDCCVQLVDIARSRKHEVMVCDNIRLPYRNNSFDAVLSIAVIHHFATTERRAHALRELARICRPGGQVMIYVWALEQKQRKFDSQDVLVPWHLQPRFNKDKERRKCEQDLPSNGSTSDEDLKKTSLSSWDKSLASKSHAFRKGRNISGTALHFPMPTTDNISHSADCPRGRGHKDGSVHRIQSDSCCDELSSVESSHFKQLLLPTRSDSVDEVFVNISSDDIFDHSPYNHGEINSFTSTQFMSAKVLGKNSPPGSKLPTQSNYNILNGKMQNPISMATSFLFDSKMFQGTKGNISSAIDHQVSETEDKSSLWDLLFGSPKTICKETKVLQTNGVCKSNAMQKSCVSNGAIGNFQVSRPEIKGKKSTFTRTQSLDRDSSLCVIQKTYDREFSNGELSYAAKHSPLIGANQPIIGLNPMTAQGQIYHKVNSTGKSPLVKNPQSPSVVDSLSSSNESLSGVPNKPARKYDGNESFAKCKPKNRISGVTQKCVTSNSSIDDNTSENGGNLGSDGVMPSPVGVANTQKIKKEASKENGIGEESRKESSVSQTSEDTSEHLRYYHVFREGELVDLIEKHVENLHIIRTYYDHANWCVVAEKVEVWRI